MRALPTTSTIDLAERGDSSAQRQVFAWVREVCRRPSLTRKQLLVKDAIVRLTDRIGCAPTLQELADELGRSKVTVYGHVESLVTKGHLARSRYVSRGLTVIP